MSFQISDSLETGHEGALAYHKQRCEIIQSEHWLASSQFIQDKSHSPTI